MAAHAVGMHRSSFRGGTPNALHAFCHIHLLASFIALRPKRRKQRGSQLAEGTTCMTACGVTPPRLARVKTGSWLEVYAHWSASRSPRVFCGLPPPAVRPGSISCSHG